MFILASKSPRRKELMKDICPFSIIVSDIDESKSCYLPPLDAVIDIAHRKGEAVFSSHPNDVVISADTIVVIDNLIIGKPKDKEDAKRILKLLSNRVHHVITAYSIFSASKVIQNHVISEVQFAELSDELIDAYIATGSPMDKAGAYGIQDNEKFHIIDSIKGSYTNIVGFPVDEIKSDLKSNHLL